MRNLLYLFPIILSFQAFAQMNQNQGQQGQNQFRLSCNDEEKILKTETVEAQRAKKVLGDCEKHLLASRVGQSSLNDPMDEKWSADKKISCKKWGGQTLDYKSCLSALNAYNSVFVAEQALTAQQTIRKTVSNNNRNEDVKNALASGNEQDAMNKVYVDSAKEDKGLFIEQASTYAAAASALSGFAMKIQSNNDSAIKTLCKGKEKTTGYGEAVKGLKLDASEADCEKIVKSLKNNSAVFANQNARKQLMAAAITYGGKAAQATMGAIDANKRSKVMEEVIEQMKQEDPDYMVDPCMVNPQSCIGRGTITPGNGNFTGNAFGPGGSGTNQNFDFGNPDGTEVYDPTAPVKNSNDGLTFDQNPFAEEAKEASGILDPAAAATVSAGSATSGGGGGGGGGLGGGGGASLGDDLQGADAGANGAADIKSNKFSGNYASKKGGGFEAVANSKDENANPFASLFDNKDGGGGLEEDRSIASGDIDGKASGLFQKISNRYEHVQKSNRLAAEKAE